MIALDEPARDQEGIKTFTAVMLVENREMRDLLDRLGPVRVIDKKRGTVDVEVALPDAGVAPELRELLRISAEAASAPR